MEFTLWRGQYVVVVQSLSCVGLCNPTDCSMPGSSVLHYLLEFTQIMPIELLMISNYLILCCPLLFLPSVFPSIRVFSKESTLRIVAKVLKLQLQLQSFQ